MKKIAKLEIKLFQSDTYRAMFAKYGAPGALLVVRLQVLEQAGTLPDFTDERQLLILSTEIGTDAATVAEMLATLRQWQSTTPKPDKPSETTDVDNLTIHREVLTANQLVASGEAPYGRWQRLCSSHIGACFNGRTSRASPQKSQ